MENRELKMLMMIRMAMAESFGVNCWLVEGVEAEK